MQLRFPAAKALALARILPLARPRLRTLLLLLAPAIFLAFLLLSDTDYRVAAKSLGLLPSSPRERAPAPLVAIAVVGVEDPVDDAEAPDALAREPAGTAKADVRAATEAAPMIPAAVADAAGGDEEGRAPAGDDEEGGATAGREEEVGAPAGGGEEGGAPAGVEGEGAAPAGREGEGGAPPGGGEEGVAPAGVEEEGGAPVGREEEGGALAGRGEEGVAPAGVEEEGTRVLPASAGDAAGAAGEPTGDNEEGGAPAGDNDRGGAPAAGDEEGAAAPSVPTEAQAEAAQALSSAAPAVLAADGFVEKVYRRLFYLKTHKSGSSAVRATLRAYCDRHGLSYKIAAPHTEYISKPAAVVEGGEVPQVVDAFFTHHAVFDAEMLASYFGARPEFVLTSLRLPLQRQLSWFRQQNQEWQERLGAVGSSGCGDKGAMKALLAAFDGWIGEKKSNSQWNTLQERGERLSGERLANNASAIVGQFDFIFLKERLAESMECLCVKHRMRLCGVGNPLRSVNAKPPDSCVEYSLLRYRSDALLMSSARDIVLYELVNTEITNCQRKGIPAECRCVEEAPPQA